MNASFDFGLVYAPVFENKTIIPTKDGVGAISIRFNRNYQVGKDIQTVTHVTHIPLPVYEAAEVRMNANARPYKQFSLHVNGPVDEFGRPGQRDFAPTTVLINGQRVIVQQELRWMDPAKFTVTAYPMVVVNGKLTRDYTYANEHGQGRRPTGETVAEAVPMAPAAVIEEGSL